MPSTAVLLEGDRFTRSPARIVPLDPRAAPGQPDRAAELERLSDALNELAGLDPRLAQLVDLHFFCGYTFGEIAGMRDVSERTVQRDWRKTRLLLHHTIAGSE